MHHLFGKPAPASVRDVALLLARIGLGVVFIAHGWQKFNEYTIAGTTGAFEQMGVPAAGAAAWFSAVVELGAGALLLVGLATPIAGVLLAANMAGAFWFVHRGEGVFVDGNGWELVVALGTAALVIAAVGAGRLSLDQLISGRRAASRSAENEPATVA